MKQVGEVIKQILEKEAEKKNLEDKKGQLRSATFGSESVDEDLATKFYKEIAETSSELETQKETLQKTETRLEECKSKLEELKKSAYDKLTNVKFPLKMGSEGIQQNNGNIVFLFERNIENEVLPKVEELVGVPLSSDKVKVFPDRIEIEGVSSIPEAMKLTIGQVERIREAAMNQLKIDDYVKKLKTRDEKIQKMLYVLYEAGKPLTRSNMETKAGLEPASLRGVLYVVLKRDPYLKKLDRGTFELTPLGKNVVKKYKEKYGSPPMKKEEPPIKPEKILTNYANKTHKE